MHKYDLGISECCISMVENNEVIIICLNVPGTVLDYACSPGMISNSLGLSISDDELYGHPN